MLCCALFAAAGCSSYEERAFEFEGMLRSGRYDAAARLAAGEARDASDADRLLWQLESGAANRIAGDFRASAARFADALETVRAWDRRPDTLLSAEALATLNNMSSLPYRGTGGDRILLSTYQALNHLSLGERDKARVALNLALERQKEAVAANAARIEQTQNETRAARGNYDVGRAERDGRFAGALDNAYGESRALRGYADYVNPFSVWLHGLFFLHAGDGSASDLERARISLRRAAEMTGNAAAREDAESAAAVAAGTGAKPPANVTYVIFETGLAPVREQVRIDVPLFIATTRVPYVGAAFPRLRFRRHFANTLAISTVAAGTAGAAGSAVAPPPPPVSTERIANVDAIVAADFNNALPSVIARTLINAGVKAAASYAVNEASARSRNAGVQLAAFVGTFAYSYATTGADLRAWHSLPKEFQIAKLPTPANRRLRLATGAAPFVEITLDPGEVNVVHVRSPSETAPLTVSQFVLR